MTALAHFETRLGYKLDAFQRAACACLEDGSSVLVAAPTGAGKTTVAEFAIELARREKDAEVIYTAPIKALSNQKYAELCAEYGSDQVALLTGDVTVNHAAPIKVMTTEVLRNIIYADVQALARLDCVILDEVHYLGDRFRGAVWEEIILHLPTHIKIVGLSATVSNAEQLGAWMHAVRGNTEVIISERRPVPLYQHLLTDTALLPLYVRGKFNPEIYRLQAASGRRKRGGAPVRKPARRLSTSKIVRALAETELLPAIVFIFSRSGCDSAVAKCLYDGVTLTTKAERAQIRDLAKPVIAAFNADERRVLRLNTWLHGLERGIAAHHAGLLPQQKSLVEQLFQARLLRIVFATETLALGINMPAKAVVLEQLKKFNGDERTYLSSGEYTQLTGRAGRRGIDVEGHAVIAWERGLDLNVLQGLASARSHEVNSVFTPTYNMAVNLLRNRSVQEVHQALERSFAQFQTDSALVADAAQLQRIQASLEGYAEAVATVPDANEAKIWRVRAQKLRKRQRALERKIAGRSGNLARKFEQVVAVLWGLGLVADPGDLADSTAADKLITASVAEAAMPHSVSGLDSYRVLAQNSVQLREQVLRLPYLKPTIYGAALAKIHGEKALLVIEALRQGVWRGLDAPQLAALISTLTYEPRRNDFTSEQVLPQSFHATVDATIRLWQALDKVEHSFGLPACLAPFTYNAGAMYAWAKQRSLDSVLRSGGLAPGDFLRWVKQTADLLGQIAFACESVIEQGQVAEDVVVAVPGDCLFSSKVKELQAIATVARQARECILHGFAESAIS